MDHGVGLRIESQVKKYMRFIAHSAMIIFGYIFTFLNQSGNQLNTDPNMSRGQSTGVAEACSKDLQLYSLLSASVKDSEDALSGSLMF